MHGTSRWSVRGRSRFQISHQQTRQFHNTGTRNVRDASASGGGRSAFQQISTLRPARSSSSPLKREETARPRELLTCGLRSARLALSTCRYRRGLHVAGSFTDQVPRDNSAIYPRRTILLLVTSPLHKGPSAKMTQMT